MNFMSGAPRVDPAKRRARPGTTLSPNWKWVSIPSFLIRSQNPGYPTTLNFQELGISIMFTQHNLWNILSGVEDPFLLIRQKYLGLEILGFHTPSFYKKSEPGVQNFISDKVSPYRILSRQIQWIRCVRPFSGQKVACKTLKMLITPKICSRMKI